LGLIAQAFALRAKYKSMNPSLTESTIATNEARIRVKCETRPTACPLVQPCLELAALAEETGKRCNGGAAC